MKERKERDKAWVKKYEYKKKGKKKKLREQRQK